uniref:IKAROS family zinc finger 4 n=1 Tax=Cynoglossus semilaevis TaxID=244447 RepID=A0A3P8UQM7_CYNSE
MDVDECNGRSYTSASGDSSMEREFSGALGGPIVSTPNSKETSPSRSLSANSIKVELYSDEDPGRSTEDERGERVEGGGGSEHGSEAVGGYRELANPDTMPSGATRLPNGKLKCDICGMICIGPNVLMVHKRSHTGERPFQCNQCGASFTQKGNLLRHIKLHSGEKPFKCPFCSYACRRRDALTGHLRTHAGKPYKCSYCGRSYKQQSTLEEHRERCHSYEQSLEPQQAGNHMRLNLADAPYEHSASLDKDGEMLTGDLEAQHFTGLGGEYTGIAGNGGGVTTDIIKPHHLPNAHSSCLPDLRQVHSSSHTPVALGPRLDCVGGREAAEGHEDLPTGRSHAPSPINGCQDSTDTESINNGHHLLYSNNHNPVSPTAPSSTSREAFRVVDGEGRPVRSFRCEHCRVIFLDHVMFTIHMGCHGFRQPFECNICGHRSQDRYEFSSHIVRGEHVFD